ncbi:hypothetical protein EYF80_038363 [Liparis tanakae]|uniref:Uncharacterized protein n=1 Tax=Liparis tanakae TaxID=230148 RepID=A0A4Z2GE28_9TELE|nr:hypothetical protein EYF80_038363 [Liparis tanakae]
MSGSSRRSGRASGARRSAGSASLGRVSRHILLQTVGEAVVEEEELPVRKQAAEQGVDARHEGLTSLPGPSRCSVSKQCRVRFCSVPSASSRFSWGSQTSAKPRLWTASHRALVSSEKGSPALRRATPPSASCRASASSPDTVSTVRRPDASRDRETALRTCLRIRNIENRNHK